MKRFSARSFLVVALFSAMLPGTTVAGDAFHHSTLAVSGYDVVSYHIGEKPLRGNGNHVATHEGVTYLFVNEDNRRAFARNPAKYVPAYGGFCAYGVSVGKKFVGDPDVWRLVDGRLYLNLDTKIQQQWAKDVSGHIRKADSKWGAIRDENPASL